MTAKQMLKTELETYEREKERLLGESEGKYVLIRGEDVVGTWDTYEDAVKTGYSKFGLAPFLVKQIQRVERVCFFTRDLASCPS